MGVTGIQWVEARNAARHATEPRMAPTTKIYLAPQCPLNVKLEKPWVTRKEEKSESEVT